MSDTSVQIDQPSIEDPNAKTEDPDTLATEKETHNQLKIKNENKQARAVMKTWGGP